MTKNEKLYKSLFQKYGSATAVNRELERQGIVEEYRQTLRKLHNLGCKIAPTRKGIHNDVEDRLNAARSLGYDSIQECMVSEYVKGKSSREVGKIMGMSQMGVRYWLHKYGVKMRSRGGANYKPDPYRAELMKRSVELGYGDTSNALLCLWRDSEDVEKVAEKFGVPVGMVEHKLQKLGVI